MADDSNVSGSSPTDLQLVGSRSIALARTLTEATLALDFDRPLTTSDPRRVDLSPARGDHARLALAKGMRRKAPGTFKHVAFVSHRGAGKSTELFGLAEDLKDEFFCLYFVANVEMDASHITREDLLLVLAERVEAIMRQEGMSLDSELLQGVAQWFTEVTQTSDWIAKASIEVTAGAQARAELPFFAKLFFGVKSLLKVESETRQKVKSTLRQYPARLLSSVNSLLDDANDKLRQAGKGELLVIIDNLDRYHPEGIDELLVRGGDQVHALRANLIVTPPISLQYQPRTGRLSQYFDVDVLHTPRLRLKGQPYDAFDGEGRRLFEHVLARRIDLNAFLPDQAALARLIAASGGAIRDLLRYAYQASLVPDQLPIELTHVQQVLSRERAELRDLINISGWVEPLVQIMTTHQLIDHKACLDLLHHRLVLKYNGDTWYDVHPLVAEIPEIQQMRERMVQKP